MENSLLIPPFVLAFPVWFYKVAGPFPFRPECQPYPFDHHHHDDTPSIYLISVSMSLLYVRGYQELVFYLSRLSLITICPTHLKNFTNLTHIMFSSARLIHHPDQFHPRQTDPCFDEILFFKRETEKREKASFVSGQVCWPSLSVENEVLSIYVWYLLLSGISRVRWVFFVVYSSYLQRILKQTNHVCKTRGHFLSVDLIC